METTSRTPFRIRRTHGRHHVAEMGVDSKRILLNVDHRSLKQVHDSSLLVRSVGRRSARHSLPACDVLRWDLFGTWQRPGAIRSVSGDWVAAVASAEALGEGTRSA
eukprot:scaffold106_cov246-Pinguiococcus_pyrenoidosus.AAC.26